MTEMEEVLPRSSQKLQLMRRHERGGKDLGNLLRDVSSESLLKMNVSRKAGAQLPGDSLGRNSSTTVTETVPSKEWRTFPVITKSDTLFPQYTSY